MENEINEELFKELSRYLERNLLQEHFSEIRINETSIKQTAKIHESLKSLAFCEELCSPVSDLEDFVSREIAAENFQNTLQKLIADRNLDNAQIYKKAGIDKKLFSKIICNKNYVPKKQTVMALGLALELPLQNFEDFLSSAGYSFMPSSQFDLIVKFCVIKSIFDVFKVDELLYQYHEHCFMSV